MRPALITTVITTATVTLGPAIATATAAVGGCASWVCGSNHNEVLASSVTG